MNEELIQALNIYIYIISKEKLRKKKKEKADIMRFGAGISILENELPGSCNGRYCACKSYLTKKLIMLIMLIILV